MPDIPSPVVDDPDTGGFWRAAQRGALAVQWCDRCAEPVHLPRPQCPHCASTALRWREIEGAGTVYSWAVVHHPVHPAFALPYTVILVALAAHPSIRLLGRVDGTPALHAQQRLRLVIDPDPAGVLIPQWEPVPDDTEGA